jgi:hypothetical protein
MKSIKPITWLTDIHFEFVPALAAVLFSHEIRANPGEALLITGDISNVESPSSRESRLTGKPSAATYVC